MKRLFTAALPIVLTFFAIATDAAAAPKTFPGTNVFNPYPEVPLYSVVEKNPLVHTTQFSPKAGGDVAAQVNDLLKQIDRTLKRADSELRNLVKLNVYASSSAVTVQVRKVLLQKLKHLPAMTFVTGGLPRKNIDVAMDAIAVSTKPLRNLKRVPDACILPPDGVVYISGQADKGELVEATGKTLEKLQETLKFLNLTKGDVVQCKAFMQPIERVEEVRAVFQKFFGKDCPPLVFVDWRSKEPVIEIEMVAASKPVAGAEPIEFLTQPGATPSPVYAKIARVNAGKLIYVSGLYGKTANNPTAEVTEVLSNLGEIVKAAGSDMTHLAKATYYVSNNEAGNKLNELRPKFYDPKRPPAASKGLVPGTGMDDRGITLDMIAVTLEK